MAWRESQYSLDWTDIGMTMNAIEQAHTAVCTFTVSLMDARYAHRFWIGVVVSTPVLGGIGQLLSVEISKEWPNGDEATFVGCLYGLLLKADDMISQRLQQMGLEEA